MTRILVVDDNPLEVTSAVRAACERANWETDRVRTAQEAFASLAERPSRLVLTNLHVAGTDVREFIDALASYTPELPVIVMLPAGGEPRLVELLRAGAIACVPAGSGEGDLVALCRRALASSDKTATAAGTLEKQFEVLIPNDRTILPGLIEFITDECIAFGVCDQSHHPRLGVAIEEAALNAIIHGNLEVSSDLRESDEGRFEQTIQERLSRRPYCDRHVCISVRLSRQECRISIRDAGPGFDLGDVPDPTDPDNLNRVSGRGILLMRAFVDDVRYNDRGNQVVLTLRRREALPDTSRDAVSAATASSVG